MKRVERWETRDGQLWDTEAEAQRHEESLNIGQLIEHMTIYGNVDPNQLLQALTDTAEGSLGDLVVAYQQRWKTG